MVREDREFSSVEALPWKKIGKKLSEKILGGDKETGAYTRLLRFDPGAETTEVLIHDFYEEVYMLNGALIDKTLNLKFTEGMYAYRNPGMKHGPYRSPEGCMTVEFRYYGVKRKGEK